MKQLTLLIPTYNREQRLKKLLERLQVQYKQGHYNIKIIISDNHSDYDIFSIITSFDTDFAKCITINRWNYNVGMSTNISLPFQYVDTDWCMELSDDDDISDDFLEVIYNDAMNVVYKDFAAIRYSTDNKHIHDDSIIKNITGFLNYYQKIKAGTDDRMYLGMLYNMNVLKPYLIYLTQYSYSYLSFWIPIMYAIIEKNSAVFFSSKVLYHYNLDSKSGWHSRPKSFLTVMLGIRTFFDSMYGLDHKSYKTLKKIILSESFRCRTIVHQIIKIDNYRDRKHYYQLLKNYMVGSVAQQVIYRTFFLTVLYLNIKPTFLKRFIHNF